MLRLTKAFINGFGRIAAGSIDLTPRLVAVVGPNEAGKSTLLDALCYLTDTSSTLPSARRSRTARPSDDTTVVRGIYVLEEDETQSFADMDLEELPRTLELSRKAGDTTRYMLVQPLPQRSRSKVAALAAEFQRSFTNSSLFDLSPSDDGETDEDWAEQKARELHVINNLSAKLKEAEGADRLREALPDLRDLLESAEAIESAADVRQAVSDLLSWVEAGSPGTEVRQRLGNMLPEALLFSDGDRTLPSTFTLSEDALEGMPASIQNLADMAGLSLPELLAEIEDGNRAAHGSRIRRANAVLKRKFNESWRQANLSVAFNLEDSTIYIEILQDEDIVTPINERSAGLRMYVALVAFLERRTHEVKPVLLIDEAETHLHLDAQADLVASFSRQQEVAKIIYTTHSPACLPADLGTNVRAVLPRVENSQESSLENSFWRNASGFTPLMIAMGAGASAFATARFVVLAEGATEMLVLPSLIRAATGLTELQYQIAPGLSESSPEDYRDLNLEGARVAFLVDSDAGGKKLEKNLLAAGVSQDNIVRLGALMLEHLLDRDVYRETYAQLLREWNPTAVIAGLPPLDERSGVPRPKQLEAWAKNIPGLRIPGKRDVASYIAEHGKAIPCEDGMALLQTLHIELVRALGIST
ncbi:AAA family ATPase [Pseudarthrobacter sp. 1C304]|uniref:AAA family ATPase n=1 Tax=Pseudarthrobacter sp. 1C304 TaxID=3457438 RepID=UPI003FD29BF8